MALKKYDPKNVVVIVGAIIINSGFAPDTFVEVERDEDAFTKSVGADGEVTRTRNRNKTGQIRITLQQSSETNALLSALALIDESTGDGVVPCAVKDLGGLTLHAAELGWVKKVPIS